MYFGTDVPDMGYPDHGNGFYGDLLTYRQWFTFQLDQRVHKNYVEVLTILVFNVLVLGLTLPKTAITLGVIQLLARIIYTFGYTKSVNGRMIGGALWILCMAVNMILSLIEVSKLVFEVKSLKAE